MASFRFKQVADAASGGLDLFIGREAEKERRALDQQWALALEELRETRAVAREERQTTAQAERDRQTNEYRIAQTKAEAERFTESQKTRREEGRLDRELRKELAAEQSSDRMVENHRQRIAERREAYQKMLDDPMIELDEEAKRAFIEKEEGYIAQDTVDFVNFMAMHNKRGFEAKAPEELSSYYQGLGVPAEVADKAAADTGLWPDLIPKGGEIPFKPNPENIGKRDIAGGKEEYFLRGQPPPETAAAASIPPKAPDAQAPEQQAPFYSPESVRESMDASIIRNPDGTPKYPANKDSLVYKLFGLMGKEIPYGQ